MASVTVEITCDENFRCCAKRGKEKLCSPAKRFPNKELGITKAEQVKLAKGQKVKRKIDTVSWRYALDSQWESGLFGARRWKRRRRK